MLNVNCNPFLIGIKDGQQLWKQEWNYLLSGLLNLYKVKLFPVIESQMNRPKHHHCPHPYPFPSQTNIELRHKLLYFFVKFFFQFFMFFISFFSFFFARFNQH